MNIDPKIQKELSSLEHKRLDWYAGINIVRHWFKREDEARRYLELRMMVGDLSDITFRGRHVKPNVRRKCHKNGIVFEVEHG